MSDGDPTFKIQYASGYSDKQTVKQLIGVTGRLVDANNIGTEGQVSITLTGGARMQDTGGIQKNVPADSNGNIEVVYFTADSPCSGRVAGTPTTPPGNPNQLDYTFDAAAPKPTMTLNLAPNDAQANFNDDIEASVTLKDGEAPLIGKDIIFEISNDAPYATTFTKGTRENPIRETTVSTDDNGTATANFISDNGGKASTGYITATLKETDAGEVEPESKPFKFLAPLSAQAKMSPKDGPTFEAAEGSVTVMVMVFDTDSGVGIKGAEVISVLKGNKSDFYFSQTNSCVSGSEPFPIYTDSDGHAIFQISSNTWSTCTLQCSVNVSNVPGYSSMKKLTLQSFLLLQQFQWGYLLAKTLCHI